MPSPGNSDSPSYSPGKINLNKKYGKCRKFQDKDYAHSQTFVRLFFRLKKLSRRELDLFQKFYLQKMFAY